MVDEMREVGVEGLSQSGCQLSPCWTRVWGPRPTQDKVQVNGLPGFSGPRHQPRGLFSTELVARLLLGRMEARPNGLRQQWTHRCDAGLTAVG